MNIFFYRDITFISYSLPNFCCRREFYYYGYEFDLCLQIQLAYLGAPVLNALTLKKAILLI